MVTPIACVGFVGLYEWPEKSDRRAAIQYPGLDCPGGGVLTNVFLAAEEAEVPEA